MSKLSKSHVVALLETKNQQERKYGKTCRVRTICKESKKLINNEEGGDKQKKQDS